MRFLVTGGAGFIGSHVCERALDLGHEVTALDDLNAFYDPAIKRRNIGEIAARGGSRFNFVQGDICDRSLLDRLCAESRFDQVIHLAARAGVRPSLEEPALYQRVNVEGTANVLEAARLSGVRKLTIASSSSVYGIQSNAPFRESELVSRPISPYAASKLATEALAHVYHHVYGLDIALLRFFTAYGPRQRPDLAIHKFAALICSGRPIPVFGDGSTSRDYTYIDDIVSGVLACASREIGCDVFNLGESQAVRLDGLIALLEDAIGKKAVIDRKPEQPGDVPLTCADISKARKVLGYAPSTPITEGIPRFVAWYRSIAN
jgi:UDP-glucuronate 4-epimerase